MMKLIRHAASIAGTVALTAGLLPLVTAPAAQAATELGGDSECAWLDFGDIRAATVCRPQIISPQRNATAVRSGSAVTFDFTATAPGYINPNAEFVGYRAYALTVMTLQPADRPCPVANPELPFITESMVKESWDNRRPVNLQGGGQLLTSQGTRMYMTSSQPYTGSFTMPSGGPQTACLYSAATYRAWGINDDEQIETVWSPATEILVAPSLPAPFPSRVNLASESGGPLTAGTYATITAGIRSGLGRPLASRDLAYGFVPQQGDRCIDTVDSDAWNINLTRAGTRTYEAQIYVAPDYAGQWMCAYQTVLGVFGEVNRSDVAYVKIEAPASGAPKVSRPPINITPLFEQLKSATDALRVVVNQPQPDQAAIEQARAAAEAARQAAEAALQQAGINAQNAGNAAGVGNAQNAGNAGEPNAQAVLEELDRTEELIARSEGTVTPRSGLQVATGFDATVTPLLPIGSRTASGMVLDVDSPTTAKKKKAFKVTASVDPGNIRGRMRMFLLYMDGPTPKLVHKRSGFIGNQKQKTKKFYINKKDKKGNYVILTSFDPTTPGQVGVATLTPLVVK